MLNIEVDGKAIQVTNGSTVMDAANKLSIYIPHFCYHKKLSIAANCRMCLVQVEKAPKPLPACATPVTDGMKVWTHSEPAIKAQKGVMEFLLINHPLDCPICDQGGECQLQDLAVGYGGSNSRYTEEKRVVFHKDVGPLVAAEEMTRCIHCTRCVRFGQEIAGIMELGMIGRGEHAEIVSFVGKTVDSELSGNMIDLCPVGALTSKPFRYSARTWELSRRKSIGPHDSLGSNLIMQVKGDRVMRVVPMENEEINECWLSDKDRFSYQGLNSTDRLTEPMIKQDGVWKNVDWQTALEFICNRLTEIREQHGAAEIGALASPQSTLEELFLLQKLLRDLGSDNIDFRLRQSDFSADRHLAGIPWLGMKITDVNTLDRILLIGSFLRKEQPLLAQRLRQAIKGGAQLNVLHSTDDDLLMKVENKFIVAPADLLHSLAEVIVALAKLKGASTPTALANVKFSDRALRIAVSLSEGNRSAIWLGQLAQHHPQAAQLHAYAQKIAELSGALLGFLPEAANSVGAYLARAYPQQGLDAQAMLDKPRKAYVLLHAEPEFDAYRPVQALAALRQAELVVALSAYRHQAVDYAQVLLPIAPFTETPGTFINCEGRVQSFHAVVKPLDETRPAWKVLRVLGSVLGLAGFEHGSVEDVRNEALHGINIASRLSNASSVELMTPSVSNGGLQRIGEVPIYFSDAIVRRAEALQRTADARPPRAVMTGSLLQQLGLSEGQQIRITQGEGQAILVAARDDTLPANCVRIASAHPSTANLAGMFDPITVERL